MANRTYVTTDEEEATLVDIVEQQNSSPIARDTITVEEYFNQRTKHWIHFLVQERNKRIRVEDADKAAIALETERVITTRGTAADKTLLEQLQARARELKR